MENFAACISENDIPLFNVMDLPLQSDRYVVFDFSNGNPRLDEIDLNEEHAFTDFVFNRIREENVPFGIGKYLEDRTFYKRSEVFSGNRSVHLGIDIWADPGQPVNAVMEGVVHSFQNNSSHGDYGPTIILEHRVENYIFYTLYGHLNTECLTGLYRGKPVIGGERIARLGTYDENVHWPPHLHFQVILDMEGRMGDFPGVCRPEDVPHYAGLCPDPNILLNIHGL